LEHTTLEPDGTTVVDDGGTTMVSFGGDELLKLRQPARASGKSKASVTVLIECPPVTVMVPEP
jgi:hypothetical protein